MDFGTIKKKLLEIEYVEFKDFLDDVVLVFKNCKKFNHPKLPVI